MNVTYTVMSKRFLRFLVENGVVDGWDDPRMPTLSGLRRRGYTPSAIFDFVRRAGISNTDATAAAELLDYCLREELGDVLFQVAFHSELEREAGRFDLDDVISDVAAKMVQRHPHVFADVTADTTEQVLTNWDQIKRETKKQKSDREVLESVTPAMPALMRTQKVLKKAAKMGADNGTTDDLRESVCKAVSGATEENGAESIGKALFNLTELARRLGVDAEQALSEACRAYIEQFGAEE